LVFITEKKSVYSAVRTGALNKAVCASSLKGYSAMYVPNVYNSSRVIWFISKRRVSARK